jgi:hypothetical protein
MGLPGFGKSRITCPRLAKIKGQVQMCYFYLLGGFSPYPSEKYAKVSWDDELPNIWNNKKCSKPPTSIYGGFLK